MFLSDGWKDYRLIDASDGERLERWGDYVLIRPDPQVIWKSERDKSSVEACRRHLPPFVVRRRRVGEKGHPGGMAYSIPRP